MKEECPICRQVTNTSYSRLIKDSCGHAKCRMCLICEEQGCKICINDRRVQNIENYDCSSVTTSIQESISNPTKNNACNQILPLELVINKDYKLKTNNSELIFIDHISNHELHCAERFSNATEVYKMPKKDEKDKDISNKLHIENFGCNNTIVNEVKTESSEKTPLPKNKAVKCFDRSHIVTIPGVPEKYKCNVCLKIFHNKKGKCYHDYCVTGVKPYQCSFCDRSFIKRSHFEYHERIHKGYKPYKCDLCEKAFPQRNKLNRHMYSHSREKPFRCPKCDKRYMKQDDLKNHLSIHNSTTTYSCKACDKSFGILTNLKRHLKTHTNERPHICEQCNKSFKDKSLLIRHKKTHGKDRPFSCAHCIRVFLSKSELRRHLAVHSDEKPFSCKYCEIVFRRKDNLYRHVRHHHLESQSLNPNKIEGVMSETSATQATAQTNARQRQKTRKTQRNMPNTVLKTPTKVSVVCISSCDQISSRLDSKGNITPVIRTTNEVSNAVSVINGPINVKNSNDKPDSKRKTFTYTEPIPLAEAVVINKRIEEKLYPQTLSNHNYFLRNCISCTDKSCPSFINETFSTKDDLKHKEVSNDNTFHRMDSNIDPSFTYTIEGHKYNK